MSSHTFPCSEGSEETCMSSYIFTKVLRSVVRLRKLINVNMAENLGILNKNTV